MSNSSDEETIEKLSLNPSSAKDLLLKEDIDLTADLFNDTKFKPLDSPHSSDKLINFSAEFPKFGFLFFI